MKADYIDVEYMCFQEDGAVIDFCVKSSDIQPMAYFVESRFYGNKPVTLQKLKRFETFHN